MSDKQQLRFYRVEDGATWWIAAYNIWGALDEYQKALAGHGCVFDDEFSSLVVDVISREEAERVLIWGDDDVQVKATQLADKENAACVLGCSEW